MSSAILFQQLVVKRSKHLVDFILTRVGRQLAFKAAMERVELDTVPGESRVSSVVCAQQQ